MKHASDIEDLRERAQGLGVELPPARARALVAYEDLLLASARRVGGISASDLADRPRLRERHVLDCLRAVAVLSPEDRTAYDLGSGAGLPGIVIAAARPELRVGLVEPRRARVAFLELALERLDLPNATVIPDRIESLRSPVDVCFARALAPVGRAWALAAPLLLPGGRLVYFAGSAREARLDQAGVLAAAPVARTVQPPGPLLESAGPLVIMTRE